MSEPRKPDTVLALQGQQGTRHKFELFRAGQFNKAEFQAQQQFDEHDTNTFRVRHNGVWLPHGSRQLMTLAQVLSLVERIMRRQFKDK